MLRIGLPQLDLLTSASRATMGGFSPSSLFAASEPGGWYDASDLTTLFQDTAGTTPVTAAGQSVGLWLDKSRGLVRGADVITNGNFATDTWWGKDSAWTISGGVATYAGATSNQIYTPASTLVTGLLYEVTFDVTAVTTAGSLPVISQTTLTLNVTTTGTYTAWVFASADGRLRFGSGSGSTWRGSIDNVVCRVIAGNHLFQTAASSRPQYNVASGLPFLLFDGSDDFLISPTITPGTDKAQVFAGVRKLSDAARGVVVELGAGGAAGSVDIEAPSSASGADFVFRSLGTSSANAQAGSRAAPITAVITGLGEISTDTCIIRANGAQIASSATDQGTGNYNAGILYVGRRGGTSLPYNGRIYGLIVRFGANLTAAQIAQAETWMNQKTGAY